MQELCNVIKYPFGVLRTHSCLLAPPAACRIESSLIIMAGIQRSACTLPLSPFPTKWTPHGSVLRLLSVLYTDFSLSFDPSCLYSWNTLTTQSGLPPNEPSFLELSRLQLF